MPKSNRAKKILLYVFAFAAKWIYLAYYKTLQIEVLHPERAPQKLPPQASQIYLFWHSKTFALLPYCRNSRAAILTLPDWKNLFYTYLAKSLGYKTVPLIHEAGAALRLKKLLKNGVPIGLAVDGPKGPCGRIKPGAIYLAHKTNRPVSVITVTAESAFRLHWRWDRYEIPYPFSKLRIQFNPPIKVADKSLTEIETEIQLELADY